jgi:hypothetical protein
LKTKGKTCIRGFKHVGRLCEGCTHYVDEKIHYQPKIMKTTAEFEKFQSELEDFEDWLDQVQNREVSCWCEVRAIKPRFKKEIYTRKGQVRLDGYVLVMEKGFFNTMPFDDVFYAHITPRQQDGLRLAPGDRFEARGLLKLDRGRLLLTKLWSLDFDTRSGEPTWNNSRALVARQTATQFRVQPEDCLRCPRGALVDVAENKAGHMRLYRNLYCLEGVADPAICYFGVLDKVDACTEHDKSG